MDLQLRGRTVLVTGASSGIGLATTNYLLEEGANVAACARNLERLQEVFKDNKYQDQLLLQYCDVTDRASVEVFVEETVQHFGGLDGAVCNAGRSLMAKLSEATDDDIREEFELKIFGSWNVVRATREHLAKSDAGSVVNINAILARQPEPRLAVTSAARAGLLNLTQTMAVELAQDGIRMNSVMLGLVDTGQWRRRYEASGTDQTYGEWSAEIAADRGIKLRRFGTAEEVAFHVVTFLSPLSGYTTGTSVDVGGGVSRYI